MPVSQHESTIILDSTLNQLIVKMCEKIFTNVFRSLLKTFLSTQNTWTIGKWSKTKLCKKLCITVKMWSGGDSLVTVQPSLLSPITDTCKTTRLMMFISVVRQWNKSNTILLLLPVTKALCQEINQIIILHSCQTSDNTLCSKLQVKDSLNSYTDLKVFRLSDLSNLDGLWWEKHQFISIG